MKQLLEQWFIRDCTGQWMPQKSKAAAEDRKMELLKVAPSYGPYRIIFMREAVPLEMPKNKKSVFSSRVRL